MRVETTENGEIQILSCLEKAEAERIRRTPDRLITACDAALENATYVDRVFDTFQDVPAAFESCRCGTTIPAHASPG